MSALLEKVIVAIQDPFSALLLLIVLALLWDRNRILRSMHRSHQYERELHLTIIDAVSGTKDLAESMRGIAVRRAREPDA